MNNISQNKIIELISNTKKIQVPENYWENLVKSRVKPTSTGSYYGDLTARQLEDILPFCHWEEYTHPAISPMCKAYRTDLSGYMGVVELSTLPSKFEGVLTDPKGTGKMEFHFSLEGDVHPYVSFSVMVVGIHEGMEVIFTLHPGDPVSPSIVDTDTELVGKTVTVAEAITLGLTNGKCISF